jgi:hypothetical protein
VEVLPDLGLLRDAYARYNRWDLIRRAELAAELNPSAGNYEELAEFYVDQKEFRKGREAYDRAIAARSDSLYAFFGRAVCALECGDPGAAVEDLEHVVGADGKFANYRAASLLAHAYALTGRSADAETLFGQVVPYSPSIETMYNYALFLKSQGDFAGAREWIQRIMQSKRTMSRYFQRRERPLFRKAQSLLATMKDGLRHP